MPRNQEIEGSDSEDEILRSKSAKIKRNNLNINHSLSNNTNEI